MSPDYYPRHYRYLYPATILAIITAIILLLWGKRVKVKG